MLSLIGTESNYCLQYELLRSQSTLEKQSALLSALEVPMPSKPSALATGRVLTLPEQALRGLLTLQRVTTSFEEKVAAGGSSGLSVEGIMKVIAREVEANGLGGGRGREIEEPVYASSHFVSLPIDADLALQPTIGLACRHWICEVGLWRWISTAVLV
jgi:hypothetical protein